MKSCITISLVEEARGGPFVLWDSLPDSIRIAAELGFDAVEIFPPSAGAIDSAQLKRLLDDHHLQLAAVGTGAGWVKHRLQLADGSAEVREQAVKFVRSIIELAGELGASAIIGSMQGRHDQVVSRQDARSYLCEALQDLGAYASTFGVPLFYEPLNRYETNQANTVEQSLELLMQVGSSHVKLLCDLFHMNIEEASIGRALIAAGEAVGHVHFVDSNRRAAGMGHIDYGPIIDALRTIGYGGYLSAEALPLPTPLEAARRTIQTYRNLITDTMR